jgi:hypothetical protein
LGHRAVHLTQYETFRTDAARSELRPNLCGETMFLAAYHRTDAFAARLNVHFGKHQNVRKELVFG